MFGQVQKVVLCMPAPEVTTDLCGAGFTPSVQDAFLLAPDAQAVIGQEIDPATAGAYFSMGFLTVLGLYIFSAVLGRIIGMVGR